MMPGWQAHTATYIDANWQTDVRHTYIHTSRQAYRQAATGRRHANTGMHPYNTHTAIHAYTQTYSQR